MAARAVAVPAGGQTTGVPGAPLVTIGILSYNRLEYLRVLVDSARECIRHPSLQWILVDGASVEPGLGEYVEGLDFLDELVVEPCTHAQALNRVLELTRADYVMILPEDVQFVVRGAWIADLVELVRDHRRVGHVCFDVQRRRTIERDFVTTPVPFLRRRVRRYRTASGREFLGYGRRRDGVNGAGIMSFCRTEVWRALGPWRTTEQRAVTNDSSLGAERDMELRYRASGLELEAVMMRYPVAADVVTDPRGTKARVRAGNRRYGRYAPPPEGRFYYRIWDDEELERRFGDLRPAPGFEDYVQPLGFELPLDEGGNLLKASVIGESESYELV
jgi:glycosyltransferase involved in cell wall biosynthesis